MTARPASRRRWALVALGATLMFLVGVASYAPGRPRSMRDFDPDRVADLELRMWQAYYRKQNVRLYALLTATLREQFHYSWLTAARAAFHMARAAATFADTQDHYERVLPDLERGYAIAREWTDGSFAPEVVARDELGWWMARRDRATSEPHHVGELMARLYADFYGVPRPLVVEAALLRAQAGDVRDGGADWKIVRELLTDSYRSLRQALR